MLEFFGETAAERWQALSAIGILLAVVVSLFANHISAWARRPRLRISIADRLGEKQISRAPLAGGDSSEMQEIESLYHHLLVENPARWRSVAHQTSVWLLRLENRSQSGWNTVWNGEVPLRWRAHTLYQNNESNLALAPQNIGPPMHCDLCGTLGDIHLEIRPIYRPNNLCKFIRRHGATHFRMTVQARSLECDSRKLRVEIEWNGAWDDDPVKMKNNLKLKES